MTAPMQRQGGKTLDEMLAELKAEIDEIKAMVKHIHDQVVGNPTRGLGH